MITIRHMQLAPFCSLFAAGNLVYKVETKAAKLKSSHSGKGPGLGRRASPPQARVSSVQSPCPGRGVGVKAPQADRSEDRGRALSEQSPRGRRALCRLGGNLLYWHALLGIAEATFIVEVLF